MKYHKRFLAQGKQKIEVTSFYTDFAAVTVALLIPAKNMYMLPAVPHISLCRSYDSRLRDVSFRLKQATLATDYGESDVRGWRFSPSCNLYRIHYTANVVRTPNVHNLK